MNPTNCKRDLSPPLGAVALILTALMPSASHAQNAPAAVNPAIQAPGVANALNPQPLPPEPPDGKALVNPAIQPSGVANALNPQPLPPIDKPGVANALNPQPLPPEPPGTNPAIQAPGVANALNPQPLPPEPPEKKRLKRRVLNKQNVQQ